GLIACDAIIAGSQDMKKDKLKCYDIPATSVSVIHNGVDPAKYHPQQGTASLGKGTASLTKFGIRKPFVFFVGRLTRQKGVFDLVDAMDHVPKGTTLVLATGKPDTPEIEDELRRVLKQTP